MSRSPTDKLRPWPENSLLWLVSASHKQSAIGQMRSQSCSRSNNSKQRSDQKAGLVTILRTLPILLKEALHTWQQWQTLKIRITAKHTASARAWDFSKISRCTWNWSRDFLLASMSDAIKNVAIFGSTGMTGLATLPIAVAAGTVTQWHLGYTVCYLKCSSSPMRFRIFQCRARVWPCKDVTLFKNRNLCLMLGSFKLTKCMQD